MELKQATVKIGIINIIINVVLNLPGPYITFRHISSTNPAPLFADPFTPSLFGGLYRYRIFNGINTDLDVFSHGGKKL